MSPIGLIPAGVGFIIVGVLLTGLWGPEVWGLDIGNLSAIAVIGPIISQASALAHPLSVTFSSVWSVFAGMPATLLRSICLVQSLDTPALCTPLGTTNSGLVLSGIFGLFIGAVDLAVAYKLVFCLGPTELSEAG